MKKIIVLRHADKDPETGQLIEEGRRRARELQPRLGSLDRVVTSNRPRLTETAELLSGQPPEIDERAGFIYDTEEQGKKLGELAKTHRFSHAGVLYENPEFEELATKLGRNLIALLQDILKELPVDGTALVVSQDGVMMAAEHELHDKPYQPLAESFPPLGGYIIDEDMQIRDLDI